MIWIRKRRVIAGNGLAIGNVCIILGSTLFHELSIIISLIPLVLRFEYIELSLKINADII